MLLALLQPPHESLVWGREVCWYLWTSLTSMADETALSVPILFSWLPSSSLLSPLPVPPPPKRLGLNLSAKVLSFLGVLLPCRLFFLLCSLSRSDLRPGFLLTEHGVASTFSEGVSLLSDWAPNESETKERVRLMSLGLAFLRPGSSLWTYSKSL